MKALTRVILVMILFATFVFIPVSVSRASDSTTSKITITKNSKKTIDKFVKLAGKSDTITVTVKTKFKSKKSIKTYSLKLLKKIIKGAQKRKSYTYSYNFKKVKKKTAIYIVKVNKNKTIAADDKEEVDHTKDDANTRKEDSNFDTECPSYNINDVIDSVELYDIYNGLYIPYKNIAIRYTGKEITPRVKIKFKDGYSFLYTIKKKPQDTEDDLLNNSYIIYYSYSDNLKVGTATITLEGYGSFTGTYKIPFEIEKEYKYFELESDHISIEMGETAQIKVTGAEGTISYTLHDENICTVGEDGSITPLSAGRAQITVTASGNENYYSTEQTVYVDIYNTDIEIPDPEDLNTGEIQISREEDGSCKYTSYVYMSIKPEKTLKLIKDGRLKIYAVDVTPKALRKALVDIGVEYKEPIVELVDETQLKYEVSYGVCNRVVKVVTEYDGNVIGACYLYTNRSCKKDYEIFAKVRKKIEEHLWTDDMTNCEKLHAIANYYNSTTHYYRLSKEDNPELWDNYTIDDNMYYNSSGRVKIDPAMRSILSLQGGFAQCSIVETICGYFAEEDLGLPYVYVDNSFVAGEGVYIGVGLKSSAMTEGDHYTLYYRDASYTADQEWGSVIDAQGLMDCHKSCSEAGCRKNLIDLSE